MENLVDSRLINLYPQQREAFKWIESFIADPFQHEATLSGYAGTGKTHLLATLVKYMRGAYCITTPVHKALRILEKTVNRKGLTFHSLHGLRPNVDLSTFDLNNPQFDTIAEPKAKHYKLIICDECSMINSSLYKLNLSRAIHYKYKILYLGDEAQLPPIGEKISPTFKIKNRFRLTEIIRQEKGNPLLEPFYLLRNDIENNTSEFTKYIFTHRNTIKDELGYILLNNIQFSSYLKDIYTSSLFKNNTDYSRHICYTNPAVSKWNKIIRNFIFPNNSRLIVEGDVLMAYNTIVDDFNNATFINSETYIVEHVRDYINDYGIKVFAVNLKDCTTSLPSATIQIVDHTDASFSRYYQILSALHLSAKTADKSTRGEKWKKYFNFRNEILSLITFKLPSINNMQIVKKDFDYGYAITAHKAQGSTFDIGTMDLRDMLYYTNSEGKSKKYNDITLINKLIYVAMTRVKKRIYLNL